MLPPRSNNSTEPRQSNDRSRGKPNTNEPMSSCISESPNCVNLSKLSDMSAFEQIKIDQVFNEIKEVRHMMKSNNIL